jgi:hypothetical protein
MFMRQIVADAISKFQKITRQMLCDKCSKNDVTHIPQNVDVLWRENYASPQNADVTSVAISGLLSTVMANFIQIAIQVENKFRRSFR